MQGCALRGGLEGLFSAVKRRLTGALLQRMLRDEISGLSVVLFAAARGCAGFPLDKPKSCFFTERMKARTGIRFIRRLGRSLFGSQKALDKGLRSSECEGMRSAG